MLNWQNFLAALALLLVFEGLMPFVFPHNFKQKMQQILQLPDETLRIAGGVSTLAGLALLYWIR